MPITLAEQGTEKTVRKITGGTDVKKHLGDLGISAGSSVTVVSSLGGNLILAVKDARIAVSRELAGKIMV